MIVTRSIRMIYENTPTLETERLILRKFAMSDAKALFKIFHDTQTNTYLPWFPVKNLEEAESFLKERFLDYYDKPSIYRYAICNKYDHHPIGYVWLSDHESHDFGYALKRAFWNRGIVTEAATAVVERIKNAGYSYITATHDINNLQSAAVMKKLGMTYQYTYVEQWQPKDIAVIFRMYQLNFDRNKEQTYMGYWDRYENHFIEEDLTIKRSYAKSYR